MEAPLRRPWVVLAPLLVGAVGLSFVAPPRYSSSTLILVAPEPVPADLHPQMSTEKVVRRLQTLRHEVKSLARLERVARELDPYGSLGKEPFIETIERMRSAVTVSVRGKDALGIEFEHRDPKMAMRVADRLTTLFMEEAAAAREREVSETYRVIDTQMQEARQRLEEKKRALRELEQKHVGQLPEQVQANLATLQRLQRAQQAVADGLPKATDAQLPSIAAPNSPVIDPAAAARTGGSSRRGSRCGPCANARPTWTDASPPSRPASGPPRGASRSSWASRATTRSSARGSHSCSPTSSRPRWPSSSRVTRGSRSG